MEKLLTLRVERIVVETNDTKTFYLQSIDNQRIDYEAGQFLTLIFDFKGREVRRSYSLSSSPDTDELLTITIKRVANGEISRLLYDFAAVGDTYICMPPMGRFTLPKLRRARHYFMVAAGSGITPILGLIKTILTTEPTSRLTLIYQTTNAASAIFYSEIEKMRDDTEGSKNLEVLYFFSRPTETHVAPQHLTKDILQTLVRQKLKNGRRQAEFYLCGPTLFMKVATMALHMNDIRDAHIHREDFVVPIEKPPSATELTDFGHATKATIRIGSKAFDIEVPFRTTILDAALAQKVPMPYSCKGGVCTSCLCQLTNGKVKMPSNEKLLDDEILKGLVLSCLAYADSEFVEIQV